MAPSRAPLFPSVRSCALPPPRNVSRAVPTPPFPASYGAHRAHSARASQLIIRPRPPPPPPPLSRQSPRASLVDWSVGPPAVALLAAVSARARLGAGSEVLFRSAEEQGTQAAWWGALRLPRTWMAEHALIALHVWVLSTRLRVDYNVRDADFNGRRMQAELFERLWEDTSRRIRNAGVVEMSVNKQLQTVQRVTVDDFRGYDEAMKMVGEDEGMELAAALWRGVFREDEGADTAAVLALADYAVGEVLSVAVQPREDVYRGWVSWGPAVGETGAERVARQRAMLEGQWRDALDVRGRLYFYHTRSGEKRWDPPEAGFYNRRRFALERYCEANPEKAAALPQLQLARPVAGARQLPPAAASGSGAVFRDLLRVRAPAQGGADERQEGGGGAGEQPRQQ